MAFRGRLNFRERLKAWGIAREAVLRHRNDKVQAFAYVDQQVRIEFIDPLTILLIIKVAVWIIEWLLESEIFEPPRRPLFGAPGFGGPEPAFDPQGQVVAARPESIPAPEPEPSPAYPDQTPGPPPGRPSLWGTPPRRSPYREAGYSSRGSLNGRDVGSIGANFLQVHALIVPMAAAIEALADRSIPDASQGMFFTGAYLAQSLIFLVCKVASAWLRNYGESLIRNLLAWAWDRLMSYVGGIWPFSRKARKERRQDRRKRRRRTLVDILTGRRRRRRASEP